MAVSTKRFSLTTSAYQDISEGNESCSFRLVFRSRRENNVRIYLGTSLPSADTVDYDIYRAPESINDETNAAFVELASTDRVYARADSEAFNLTVYRR